MRFASRENTRLGQPEVGVGLHPGDGGAERLPHLVGRGRALEIVLAGNDLFEKLGSTSTRQADVRGVAATNRDLAALVAEKHFRMDLYYRLNVFPIGVPPLRRRPEDIPLLVAHFVQKFGERMSKQISWIPKDTIDVLMRYARPGNVRELQNYVERAVILTERDVLQMP